MIIKMRKLRGGMISLILSAAMLTGCGTQSAASSIEAGSDSTGDSASAAAGKASGTASAGTSASVMAAVSLDTSGDTDISGAVTGLSKIDNTKWQYNSDDDVYYQIGISYCEKPADDSLETLAVFVPGGYMNAKDNGDGTYTCEIASSGAVGDYIAESAPFVLPVNTPGYSAQDALTEYQSFKGYTDQGFIYVHAGCRGRDDGAPTGVTDLKAAVRYIRYCADVIPGSTARVFSFGMSGGGAQSALLGVTGDSAMYDDYLTAIGAVTGVSDAILGSMDWCPITSLDSADEAYEWNMGNTRSGLSSDEQSISDDLTAAYADYINSIGLTDTDGNELTLEQSDDGRYPAGSYYDFIKEQIETSLNNFLGDTEFPYDADASSQVHQAGMGTGGPGGAQGGTMPDGGKPDGNLPDGEKPDGNAPDGTKTDGNAAGGTKTDRNTAGGTTGTGNDTSANDNITRTESTGGLTISGTYETVQDYIDALNADGEWVTYDAATGKATISSIADFTAAVKNASKGIAAFDQLDAGQGENTLFGYGDGEGAHFDSTLAGILKDKGSDYASSYETDLAKTDAQGHDAAYRLNMYSPLYYLMKSSDGFGTSTVAKYFRIRTGAWQSDTSITTEINLALALENYSDDASVDFATVWGQEHTTAERSGDSTTNFIEWVNECCK